MADPENAPRTIGATREERLAAKLRENLRRRKAQSRALEESPDGAATLSKPAPNR